MALNRWYAVMMMIAGARYVESGDVSAPDVLGTGSAPERRSARSERARRAIAKLRAR